MLARSHLQTTAELHVLYVQLVREKSLMADFRQIARNSRDTSKA
jgi:hypothetical protein